MTSLLHETYLSIILPVPVGTVSIANRLSARMTAKSVVLSSPVAKISQRLERVVIMMETSGARYRSEQVVVSVPTAFYKDYVFEPKLPADKLELSWSTILGFLRKMVLLYDES